ncbi:ankyrin repeat domain-containing protein [Candidatus Micrarchaeota archaeon]|nr:ankyrin repeat domain-containing protein [Candidatus Micrarchaeota archaeon]
MAQVSRNEATNFLLTNSSTWQYFVRSRAIENGADVNARDGNKLTAVMLSINAWREFRRDLSTEQAFEHWSKCFGVLCKAHADLEVRDNEGRTAFFIAASDQIPELMHAIVQAGANVNAQNDFGETALTHALANSFSFISGLLFKVKGIDVNLACKNGWTALMHAAANNTLK